MKRQMPLMLLLALLISASACGGDTPPAAPTAAPEQPVAGETTVMEDMDDDDIMADIPAVVDTIDITGTNGITTPMMPVSPDARLFAIVPEESEVRYAVDKVLFAQRQEAVIFGVTKDIEGTIIYDPEQPQQSQVSLVVVDISKFESDEEQRDDHIRREWLESGIYPLANFVPTGIEGIPADYQEGEEVEFQILGDLTIRDVTRPVAFDTTASVTEEEVRGNATTTIKMTDFGFEPPNALDIFKVEDDVQITFNFVARP